MKRLNIVFGSLGAMCLLALLISSGPPSSKPTAPIPLAEVRERGIEGRLGERLGKIIEVSGKVIKNDLNVKDDFGVSFLLLISEVNKRKLSDPLRFPFKLANRFVELEEPKIGDMFHYAGYETGRYGGFVDGEFDYVSPYAARSFFFTTEFLILGKK